MSNTLASGNAVRKGSNARGARITLLSSRKRSASHASPFFPSENYQNALKRKGDLIKGVTGEFTASYDELLKGDARAAAGSQQNLALTGLVPQNSASKFSVKSIFSIKFMQIRKVQKRLGGTALALI